MNSKAQAGNILATFPTIIFVTFIMILFVFISAGVYFLKNPSSPPQAYLVPIDNYENPLLFTVQISYSDKITKEVTILDALIEHYFALIKIAELKKENNQQNNEKIQKLIQFATSVKTSIKNTFIEQTKNSNEKTCLIMLISSEKDFGYGKIEETPLGSSLDLTPTGKDLFIEFYNDKVTDLTNIYDLKVYETAGYLKKISITATSKSSPLKNNIIVQYYYGKCIE